MVNARRQHDWQLASTLVWITAEVNRDRKRRRKPFKPDDFNPCVTTRPALAKASVKQVASLLGAKFHPSSN
ncbi:hypothetical protein [Crateriforma spongiae]|uniref:hypothetical protein n=1 Tax=Crateriforma spongiae TaxID=2724528 RepID=UPI00144706A6|nr:hypothetical protein [Crateriforma spongiae]